jgi:phytoene dehydrogenase-like protein
MRARWTLTPKPHTLNPRGLEKRGGRLMLGAHVERVTLDARGRADGVALRGGGRVRARRAVVTNASVWDSAALLGASGAPAAKLADARKAAAATPPCRSFMHRHVGFDAAGAGRAGSLLV